MSLSTPSNLETQHYHPCCSSGFDLGLKVLEWPLPYLPEGSLRSNLPCDAESLGQYHTCSCQSPSRMIKSCLWISLFPGLSNRLPSHPPLWSAPLRFFSHMDFPSPTSTYLIINFWKAGQFLRFCFPYSGCIHILKICDKRILDQESLIDKKVKTAGSDQVLILPMDFVQHAPCLSSQEGSSIEHQRGTSLNLFPNLRIEFNSVHIYLVLVVSKILP